MSCFELALQVRDRAAGWQKEIAVDPLKLAVNFFAGNDRLHPIDRGGMTLGVKPSKFFAQHFLDLKITIVERVDQVRGGAPGHATADRSVVDEDNITAFARE